MSLHALIGDILPENGWDTLYGGRVGHFPRAQMMKVDLSVESSLSAYAEGWRHQLSLECSLTHDNRPSDFSVQLMVGGWSPVLYTLTFSDGVYGQPIDISVITQEILSDGDPAMLGLDLSVMPWQVSRDSHIDPTVLDVCLQAAMKSMSEVFGGHTHDCFSHAFCQAPCKRRRETPQPSVHDAKLTVGQTAKDIQVQFIVPTDMPMSADIANTSDSSDILGASRASNASDASDPSDVSDPSDASD
jgi:hypothetical protein